MLLTMFLGTCTCTHWRCAEADSAGKDIGCLSRGLQEFTDQRRSQAGRSSHGEPLLLPKNVQGAL